MANGKLTDLINNYSQVSITSKTLHNQKFDFLISLFNLVLKNRLVCLYGQESEA